MTLADLASVGSFVSAVAVLLSLIYLNIQVRQAARNQRSLLLQGQAARWLDLQIGLAHPSMAPVWNNTVESHGELTTSEYRQVRHVVTAYFKNGEESFIQHQDGLLTETAFEAVRHVLRAFLGFPRVRVIWRMSRELFDADYVRCVDQLLEEAPLFEAEAALVGFNVAVAAEVAQSRGVRAEGFQADGPPTAGRTSGAP